MADIKVPACTWKTTKLSSSLATPNIKHEPLADGYDEQLLSNYTNLNDSTDKTSLSSLFTTTNVKSESLEADLNEQSSSHNVNLEGDNLMGKTGRISSFHMTDSKCEPLEVDLSEHLSSHSINQQEDTFMNKTGRIPLFPMIDSKCEPSEIDLNEQSSSHSINLKGDDFMDKTEKISPLSPTRYVKCEPLEVDLNEQSSSHSINRKEDDFMDKTEKISLSSPSRYVKCEPLEVDLNEQLSYSSVSLQEDHCADKTRSLLLPVINVKLEPLADNINEQFSSNCTVLNEKNSTSIVAIDELAFEIQLLHDTNGFSDDENNKFDNAENKMDDINQSPILSTVQTQIRMKNIDQTSDILHEQKEIETDDINQTPNLSNWSNIKMEKLHQPSDLFQGQNETQIFVLTNRNFTECNDIKNETHLIRKRNEKVQDGAPTLNNYQENTCEYEQTSCMHNFHLYHSYVEHDHNYYNMSKEVRETETRRKENAYLLRVRNILRAKKEQEEQQRILREQRKEELKLLYNERHKSTLYYGEPFLCKFCGISFQSRKEVSHHKKFNHDFGPKECDICHKTFKSSSVMREHRSRIHINKWKRTVFCSICGKKLSSRSSLKTHLLIHSDERAFKCSICDAKLKTISNIKNHIRTCHKFNDDVGPKECDICHKTFKSSSVMLEHRSRIHINKWKRTVFCSICGKKFPSSSSLKTHLLIHSDERPFECSYCDSKFQRRCNLTQHVRNCHDARVVFSCTEPGCDRKYNIKDRFERHIKWHQKCKTGERPFQCSICDAKLKTKCSLTNHIRNCHSTEKVFPCTESGCDLKYNRKDSWQRHMKWHQMCKTAKDERPFQCSICDARLKTKSNLSNHIRNCHIAEKVFSCTESGCDLKYYTKDSWQRHMEWHQKSKNAKDERPFKCSYCDAEFKLGSYLLMHVRHCHVAGKVFSCKVSGCNRKYYRKDIWRRHMKWHRRCKSDTRTMHTIRTWSKEDISLLRDVFKEEIAGKKTIGVEKIRRFITKYPSVLKDVKNQNGLRSQKIRTKLNIERFINRKSVNNTNKTKEHLTFERSVNNIGETKAHVPSELSVNNSGETKAHVPSELSVNNSGETKAHVPSELSVKNNGENKSHVPSELSVNNIDETKAHVPSELSVNNIGETKAHVPSELSVKNNGENKADVQCELSVNNSGETKAPLNFKPALLKITRNGNVLFEKVLDKL